MTSTSIQSTISSSLSSVREHATGKNLLAAAGALVGLYTARALYHSYQLPPGPWGLPILGRLPWIDTEHFEESEEAMRQQYGPIYSYRAGQRLMIVVSSYEMMKEMLKEDIFSGRPVPATAAELADGCGYILAEGQTWMEQRRVSLRLLRDFGFGKQESINFINDQVDAILTSIEKQPKEIESKRLFCDLANGVIGMLMFNRKYANEDDRYDQFLKDVDTFLSDSLAGSLSLLFPTFTSLLRHLPATKNTVRATLSMHKFFEEEIRRREAELTEENTEPLCVCDAYIQERKRSEAKGDYHTHRSFHLVRICMEMFIAGTDTTSLGMQWLLLYVAVNPKAQARVQQELDDVIGRNRRPQVQDRHQLHYTMAVIDESLRLGALAFNSLTHRAMKDTKFRGYRIPADAVLVPFVFGLHRDGTIWERPDEFYPEHFLDERGQYKPSKYLVPFSIGKRVCPGESLARLEAYLSFTGIMQRYSVALADSCSDRQQEILRGYTTTPRQPASHRVSFSRRP